MPLQVSGSLTSTQLWQPAWLSLECIPAPRLGVTHFCPGLPCSPSTSALTWAVKRGQELGWEDEGLVSCGALKPPAI